MFKEIKKLTTKALKDDDTELLAELIVNLLLFKAVDALQIVDPEPEKEIIKFDENMEEIPGLRVVETEDKEVEHGREMCVCEAGLVPDDMGCPVWVNSEWEFIPYHTQADNLSAYFTVSGDIHTEEDLDAGRFAQLQPEEPVTWYSAAKSDGKTQTRNFHRCLMFIVKNENSPLILRKAWNKMWRRHFYQKENQMIPSLWGKHLNGLVLEFNRRGIQAKSFKAKTWQQFMAAKAGMGLSRGEVGRQWKAYKVTI